MHNRNNAIICLVLLIPTGCPTPPPDGIRVECDGSAVGFVWWSRPISYCEAYDPRCYIPHYKFPLCIDPSALDGETGDDGDWVNDTEDLDHIRGQCAAECNAHHSRDAWMAKKKKKCDDGVNVWTIRNEDGLATPDPGHAIKDPMHLSCLTTENSNLRPKPNPKDLTVIAPGTSPRWPSSSEHIELICNNFQDCSEEFHAPILGNLFYEDLNGEWGDNMGRADYVAVTSTDTATAVTLSIANPNAEPSTETNEAEGRIEYSAAECGETECPFYVSNMTVANPVDSWDLWSEFQGEVVHVTDIRASLRRPVLGIWNTQTREVYIGEGMMEVHIEATGAVGDEDLETSEFYVVNSEDLFGELRDAGGVSFPSLAVNDGTILGMEANLDYDVLTEGPPTAAIGLPATVVAPTEAGLPLATIESHSSDPDGDIRFEAWVVDGEPRADDYVIPIGVHTILLHVEDERGAFDIDEQVVKTIYQ
jgi:hypothetical protein